MPTSPAQLRQPSREPRVNSPDDASLAGFQDRATRLERDGLTLAFALVTFSQLSAKMLVSPSVALQMIAVLVESLFFWARSDTVDLGEGGAKPKADSFHLPKGESRLVAAFVSLRGLIYVPSQSVQDVQSRHSNTKVH